MIKVTLDSIMTQTWGTNIYIFFISMSLPDTCKDLLMLSVYLNKVKEFARSDDDNKNQNLNLYALKRMIR